MHVSDIYVTHKYGNALIHTHILEASIHNLKLLARELCCPTEGVKSFRFIPSNLLFCFIDLLVCDLQHKKMVRQVNWNPGKFLETLYFVSAQDRNAASLMELNAHA
jgi:hypothetical protein